MATVTDVRFHVFQQAISAKFRTMVASGDLFTVACDRDALWETYLSAFPAGSNPMFRNRTEHDCSCCRHFIKSVGHLVQIDEQGITSLWDDLEIEEGHPYRIVADRVAAFVKSHPIKNLFLHRWFVVGQTANRQQTDAGVLTFEHFYLKLPVECVKSTGRDEALGDYATTHAVLLRGLSEITTEALETVIDLIRQNSLYRGEEHRRNVETFLELKRTFDRLPEAKRALFGWQHVKPLSPAVSRLKNTVIGSLLCNLSEGMDLEQAVKSFEQKVAPTNYRRPTALVTKGMIEKAKKDLTALGLTSALERRYATVEDLTVNNVLFVDRDVRGQLKGDVFAGLEPTKPLSPKAFEKIEEIPIETFVTRVLPTARSLEILVENRHCANFVSLIAPVHADAKPLFKWPNGFSWSYAGDLADSIKERVKQAGGNVTGDLRCSLSWFNHDDLDLHMTEPRRYEIYYGNKGYQSVNGGVLDVDMNAGVGVTRTPVENICYASRARMHDGSYLLSVHQYSKRETRDVGFTVELEFDGVIHTFQYEKALRQGEVVDVATIRYTQADGFQIVSSLPSAAIPKNVWGITTHAFRKVSMVLGSPNHWDGHQIGNKHYFFMLDGCRQEGSARGFFNEFLTPELDRHRKVMELVGSKVRTDESDRQLSGVGFSSTQRNSVVCRVGGSFNRQVRVII